MAAKIIVVLGATGRQGEQVVNSFIGKQDWIVRAVTRNTASEKAQALAKRGVEVVKGDVGDQESLKAAFKDATAIFAITDFIEPFLSTSMTADEAEAHEVTLGKNIVDVASTIPTLEHFIWSTLPAARKITNGAFPVPHCDGKAEVDDYIKTSPLKNKTTYLIVAGYLQNIVDYWIYHPLKLTLGKRINLNIIIAPCGPKTPVEMIDHTEVGKYVTAIIDNPEKTLGKQVYASSGEEDITFEHVAKLIAKYAGISDFRYLEVTSEAYNTLYPKMGWEIALFMKYFESVGSFTGGRHDLTGKDLGIEGVTLEDFLKAQDWKSILAAL